MRKTLKIFILFLLISIFLLLGILSTNGIQTGKFNDLIYQRINDSNYNVKTRLNDIKFKLDIKELSLFLETKNPVIIYRNTPIPTSDLKVYIDFLSILKNDTKIKKIIFVLDQINIDSSQIRPIATQGESKGDVMVAMMKNKLMDDGKSNINRIEYYEDSQKNIDDVLQKICDNPEINDVKPDNFELIVYKVINNGDQYSLQKIEC